MSPQYNLRFDDFYDAVQLQSANAAIVYVKKSSRNYLYQATSNKNEGYDAPGKMIPPKTSPTRGQNATIIIPNRDV